MTIAAQLNSTTSKLVWSFNRRALISSQENKLWQIEKGIVRSSTLLDDGTIVTLGLWGCGDVVGVALSGVKPYQLECVTAVQVISLTPNQPEVEIVLAHLKQLQELSSIRSYKRVDIMLLKLLSWLGQKFGQQVETGQLIDLRLTHQDIADTLGTTRVTITRTLSQLEQQGAIKRLSLHRIIVREEDVWYYQI